MQRIIVIPDSFKGALSSREAGSAIATGLASVTDTEVLVVPIADGGEGTVEAFVAAAGGALRSATVCGVFYGERVPVHYLEHKSSRLTRRLKGDQLVSKGSIKQIKRMLGI